MNKKYFVCGDLKIIAKYTDYFTVPKYWGDNERPEYKITVISPEGKRAIITAWGNMADSPDEQHKDLARLVIAEMTDDPYDFKDFCGNFGYEENSRKAYKIWQVLNKRFANGYWAKYAKISHITNEPVIK